MVRSSRESPARICVRSYNRRQFRKKLIAGLVLIAIILSIFPFFFQAIEKRHGFLMNDWILDLFAGAQCIRGHFLFYLDHHRCHGGQVSTGSLISS